MPDRIMQAGDGLTIAQRIFAQLKTKVTSMQDGGSTVWRRVDYGTFDDLFDAKDEPLCIIERGMEEKESEYGGCTQYIVPVFYHFSFRGKRGLDEFNAFLYYVGLLQKTVLSDHNLGGLTLNIEDEGNTHTLIGIEDVHPGGTLNTLVQYRTKLHDPYKLPGT